jgi:type II secretory pathway pseudopilin PulG
MRKTSEKPAFTLVEIILGITVLTIVLVSITVLTLTSIQANSANIHKLTAYYLAQEGAEGVRNMRDSNWLQNHVWNTGGVKFWGDDFTKDGFYALTYEDEPGSNGAPWVLESFGDDLERARLAGQVDDFYTRYITLEYDVDNADKMEVTAIVEWTERNRDLSMEVSTQLTDWREGPL